MTKLAKPVRKAENRERTSRPVILGRSAAASGVQRGEKRDPRRSLLNPSALAGRRWAGRRRGRGTRAQAPRPQGA